MLIKCGQHGRGAPLGGTSAATPSDGRVHQAFGCRQAGTQVQRVAAAAAAAAAALAARAVQQARDAGAAAGELQRRGVEQPVEGLRGRVGGSRGEERDKPREQKGGPGRAARQRAFRGIKQKDKPIRRLHCSVHANHADRGQAWAPTLRERTCARQPASCSGMPQAARHSAASAGTAPGCCAAPSRPMYTLVQPTHSCWRHCRAVREEGNAGEGPAGSGKGSAGEGREHSRTRS